MKRLGRRADRHADLRADRPRVFCVGLNKTATSSFHEAVTVLGLDSLHHGGPEVEAKISDAVAAKVPLLSNLDPRYDAFSDIGQLSRRYMMLDEQYRGSRFVLTVRPIEAWLDSRRRHVEHNVRRKEAGEYTGRFVVVEEDKWRDEWNTHVDKIRTYFAGRDNFLEIDLTDAPTWGPLCSFLAIAEPEVPFPWANRDPDLRL